MLSDRRKQFGLVCGPGRTKQAFRDECDINTVIAKSRLGLPPDVNRKVPMFGDVSQVPDFQTSLSVVEAAQKSFSALPSGIRSRFDNDPAKLVQFVSDFANRDQAIELGLLPKVLVTPGPVPAPAPAPAAAPPAA